MSIKSVTEFMTFCWRHDGEWEKDYFPLLEPVEQSLLLSFSFLGLHPRCPHLRPHADIQAWVNMPTGFFNGTTMFLFSCLHNLNITTSMFDCFTGWKRSWALQKSFRQPRWELDTNYRQRCYLQTPDINWEVNECDSIPTESVKRFWTSLYIYV